ncbi:MBL fold metallo-hydrolase [Halorubrum sp. GN11_10-6_MGM]|uniref:MBL fold metallo-hydrolase n=1 Tax=Halorubrum sp. GN11_10-6_MGM TaxID=2518112 RepID=UPI0010F68535|nr:MBL fold metallo-hydrolase [Halorubrum sp. GN11_10-6_MGM]TKX75210.1 MBL fold metallo-hydrolase [Halorubrum sp. GN11_10-6_MGM]
MTSDSEISVQLVRNATVLATVDDTTFLVDPMFTPKGELPTVTESPGVPEFLTTANQKRNPLVELPDVEIDYDAVVVTHRHPDHWDPAAVEKLDAEVPLFCQPEETDGFREEGFTDVRPVEDEASFEGVTVHRTPGQHGHGDLAEGMGPVSGFVFEGDRTLYITGDTIWYDPVKETLDQFEPDMVVLNGGEAQFDQGEPITMGVEDITAVREAADAIVAVVHMEAINHCLLSREELEAETENVLVPEDGDRISL